jgi:hypothetical protein
LGNWGEGEAGASEREKDVAAAPSVAWLAGLVACRGGVSGGGASGGRDGACAVSKEHAHPPGHGPCLQWARVGNLTKHVWVGSVQQRTAQQLAEGSEASEQWARPPARAAADSWGGGDKRGGGGGGRGGRAVGGGGEKYRRGGGGWGSASMTHWRGAPSPLAAATSSPPAATIPTPVASPPPTAAHPPTSAIAGMPVPPQTVLSIRISVTSSDSPRSSSS